MNTEACCPETDSSLYEARAEVFRALAHPTRLRLLECLADGEHCVCELHVAVGSSLPTVSRHLAQMKAAGLLGCRREGNNIHYRLLVPCITNTLACIDEALRADSDRRAEVCSACSR
ncbi:MAG TPA: metalloregulator ArsR/SmtB family transcription factor [Armatimonadota bacterium]|jgi:ArsR family transcriptional regulator